MAELGERRDSARKVKESIVADARTLAASSEWGEAAGGFRDLMTRWKAAGVAPREVDDALLHTLYASEGQELPTLAKPRSHTMAGAQHLVDPVAGCR